MKRVLVAGLLLAALNGAAFAENYIVKPIHVTDWKAVYGRIETRDRIAARARLGGTVMSISVAEGDAVKAGQKLAVIVDDKLAFQLAAMQAQRNGISAQLESAEADLARTVELQKQGVATLQRLQNQQAQVDALRNQITSLEAQADVITQSQAEGEVLAPMDGRVLDVPLAKGAVVMPGEVVALVGGGGTYLRLAVPERLAGDMHENDPIRIEGPDGQAQGRLARVYPLIENGRVIADVEVEGLSDRFVDARVLVHIPVGKRQALMVPNSALVTRDGVDMVATAHGEDISFRAVVSGNSQEVNGQPMIEILSGIRADDAVVINPPSEMTGHE